MIQEENVSLDISHSSKISRELRVFYNPLMKENRDITLTVIETYLKHYSPKEFVCLLPLEGTGVRGIRIQKAFPKAVVLYNDISPTAVQFIEKHLELNGVTQNYSISQLPADQFLLKQKMADFIDIDPFGSPNPFLDAAIKRIKHKGLLAITATDTAAMCGSSQKAGLRKYGTRSQKDIPWQHEFGVRSFIAHVQRLAAQFEKTLIPIFVYPKRHYYRFFFIAYSLKSKVDTELLKHQFVQFTSSAKWKLSQSGFSQGTACGPLYTGELCDLDFIQNKTFTQLLHQFKISQTWFETYVLEHQFSKVGTYNISQIAQDFKIKQIPNFVDLIQRIQTAGYSASKTVFQKESIRSNIPSTKLLKLLIN